MDASQTKAPPSWTTLDFLSKTLAIQNALPLFTAFLLSLFATFAHSRAGKSHAIRHRALFARVAFYEPTRRGGGRDLASWDHPALKPRWGFESCTWGGFLTELRFCEILFHFIFFGSNSKLQWHFLKILINYKLLQNFPHIYFHAQRKSGTKRSLTSPTIGASFPSGFWQTRAIRNGWFAPLWVWRQPANFAANWSGSLSSPLNLTHKEHTFSQHASHQIVKETQLACCGGLPNS